MSALTPKADIDWWLLYVRFVPLPGVALTAGNVLAAAFRLPDTLADNYCFRGFPVIGGMSFHIRIAAVESFDV